VNHAARSGCVSSPEDLDDRETSVSSHRRRRFLARMLCERLWRRSRRARRDNYFTGRKENIAPAHGIELRVMPARHLLPALRRCGRDLQPRLPPRPCTTIRSACYHQDHRLRRHHMLASAKRVAPSIPFLDLRGLRRPQRASAYQDYRVNVNPSARAPATTKASAAPIRLFFDYHRQHNLRIKVARIVNTLWAAPAPERRRVVLELQSCRPLQHKPSPSMATASIRATFCLCRRSDRASCPMASPDNHRPAHSKKKGIPWIRR